MKLTLFTLTACCCIIVSYGAINEIKNNNASKTGDPKGRFLSLPVPAKCSGRK